MIMYNHYALEEWFNSVIKKVTKLSKLTQLVNTKSRLKPVRLASVCAANQSLPLHLLRAVLRLSKNTCSSQEDRIGYTHITQQDILNEKTKGLRQIPPKLMRKSEACTSMAPTKAVEKGSEELGRQSQCGWKVREYICLGVGELSLLFLAAVGKLQPVYMVQPKNIFYIIQKSKKGGDM